MERLSGTSNRGKFMLAHARDLCLVIEARMAAQEAMRHLIGRNELDVCQWHS